MRTLAAMCTNSVLPGREGSGQKKRVLGVALFQERVPDYLL